MALKSVTWTAEDGDDAGKKFLLTRMPAAKAESLALRACFSIMEKGIELPDSVEGNMGFAALGSLGLSHIGKISWDVVELITAQLMAQVQYVVKDGKTRPVYDNDIEEVETLIKLKAQVLALHVDFTKLGETFKSLSYQGEPNTSLSDTETSQP